ncbi:MAG: hypothetical protein IKL36_02650 [Clostridia bacterium]|nr:hypothetical protein [Clostridia bacterium]
MNKQTGVNFIAQVISFAINICISFFLTPFIIKNIGIEANGFVTLANNVVEYAQIFTLAINSMASRFITIKLQQKNYEDANKYFSSIAYANIIMSVVFSVGISFVIIFLDKFLNISETSVTDIKILWIFVAINFIISLFVSIYYVPIFAADRLDVMGFTNARGSILRAVTLVLCYTFFRPYTFYVGIASVLLGLNSLITYIHYKKKLLPDLCIKRKYYDFACIKDLVASGIWNSVTKLSTILSSGLDLLIANIFVNGVAMGVLNVSKTVPNIVYLLFSMLSSTLAPQLTIAYANNDFEEMKRQLISSIKFLGVFSSIPIAILMGLGENFFALWLPDQNSAFLHLLTVIICIYLIFALPLEPLYNIFTVINKVKISSIALVCFSVGSILTVLIGLPFIQSDEAKVIYIAAVGSFFTMLKLLTFIPLFGAKCLNFKYTTFYSVIFKNFISVCVLLVIAVAINRIFAIDTWIKLFAACIAVAIIGLVSNVLILYNKDERHSAKEKVIGFAKKYLSK